MPAGRPSKFTEKLGAEICQRLADGESLRAICRDEHMPSESTVRAWALELDTPFSAQYAKARDLQAQRWSDELLDIADDGTNDWMERQGKDGEPALVVNGEAIARSRLRVDTRKWLLSKVLPKKYGERVVNEHEVSDKLADLLREIDGVSRGLPGRS